MSPVIAAKRAEIMRRTSGVEKGREPAFASRSVGHNRHNLLGIRKVVSLAARGLAARA